MYEIIDAHVHFSNIERFSETADRIVHTLYSGKGFQGECLRSKVVCAIGMGLAENRKWAFPDQNAPNPMLLDLEETLPDNLFTCIGVNPYRLDEKSLKDMEALLELEHVVGFKLYPGYYHTYPHDEVYKPVYLLAEKYDLPVAIHSGDTYGPRALLKYAHPLEIDEVAYHHPEVRIVLSHFGDPWTMEAAEVVYKNNNVYADLSGIIVGDANKVKRFSDEQLYVDHFRKALIYCDRYDKILFGSDWPLVSIAAYAKFIEILIPLDFRQAVFHDNALKVYTKLKKKEKK